MGFKTRLVRGNFSGAFDVYYRQSIQGMERAAIRAVGRGGKQGERAIRGAMQGAGLNRLGNAVKATADTTVHRRPGGFSVSATIAIRSGSERTRGAIEAYTQGADIVPVRGRWLWIPTDEIQRLVGRGATRRRLEPRFWKEYGLDTKIGPLVLVLSINGNPLLVVKNVGVNAAGLPGKARALLKNGRPRRGQRLKEFVVAFVGIPRTSRAARVDPAALLSEVQGQLIPLWVEEMGKEGKR